MIGELREYCEIPQQCTRDMDVELSETQETKEIQMKNKCRKTCVDIDAWTLACIYARAHP